ncbi:MAG: hypothetical protein HY527_13350 [Betaproteobacteria bacterium]|nr:hypothetical protein [Betaproteobacteria bacterium]
MEDSAFSEAFCRFIQTAVPSVPVAELLLLIFKQPERWWTLPELLGELPRDVNITEAGAVTSLESLRSRGLVEFDDNKRVRYRAASDALDAQVHTLAQAYNERPVTLIRMIYALRDTRIQSFADAFKFRKR